MTDDVQVSVEEDPDGKYVAIHYYGKFMFDLTPDDVTDLIIKLTGTLETI
jgi:hypothetical protein